MAKKEKKTSRKDVSLSRSKKETMTSEQLEHFKQLLLEKRREILGNVNEMEGEALKKSRMDASGDLSSMPIHMADVGSDNFEQELSLGLVDSERRMIKEIDDALDRIAEGVYGLCEGTGKPIPLARLDARPWARYCVEYARMIEKGLVPNPEDTDEAADYSDASDEGSKSED